MKGLLVFNITFHICGETHFSVQHFSNKYTILHHPEDLNSELNSEQWGFEKHPSDRFIPCDNEHSAVLVKRAGCVICKIPFGRDIVKGRADNDQSKKPGERSHEEPL